MISETPQEKIHRRRWLTLAVLSLSLLIVAVDNTIVNIAIPTLQAELETSYADLQWIVDAYVLAFATLLMTMGALGDRLGRAHLLRTGVIIFGAASLGASFADSAPELTAARAVMGIGAAMIMPATLAIITNVFPIEERGKALGAWGAVVGAGIALGPILGGVIIEYWNWAGVFLINVPIAAVALIGGHFLVPNSKDPNPRRLDAVGTILSGATLGIVVFGLIRGGEWGWTEPSVIGTLTGGVLCGALFVLWERHTPQPMLDMWLFRHPRFSSGVSSVTLMIMCQMGMVFALTQYMQAVLGYSALDTGLRFLPFAFGQAIGASQSHRFVAKVGTNRVIFGAFTGFAVLAIGASFWQADTSFIVLGPMFFVWAFCMGNVMPPSAEAILGAVPVERAGVGSATNSAAVQVGAAVGVAALGSVLSTVYSSHIKPTVDAIASLPEGLSDSAKDSVGQALKGVSDALKNGDLSPEVGGHVIDASKQSFVDGWQVMALVACGIAIVAGLVVLKFMPPRHLTPTELVSRGLRGLP